ncbi:hypothetical protein [Bradyrhizobium genosp. P]|uniref:hypothetical protein n=1 Tax=Bradyrhizobium genosp. P TaxID=83641 RepID=UPI003CEB1536
MSYPNVTRISLHRPFTVKVCMREQGAETEQHHAAYPDETGCRQIGRRSGANIAGEPEQRAGIEQQP